MTTAPETLVPWDESRPTGAPRNKQVRTPEEAVDLARRNPGQAVLYSANQSKASARLRAKKIKRGDPAVWQQWRGRILAGAYQEGDGTYSVRIAWIEGAE